MKMDAANYFEEDPGPLERSLDSNEYEPNSNEPGNQSNDSGRTKVSKVQPKLKDYTNPMETLTEYDFLERYHMSKEIVRDVLMPIFKVPLGKRGAPVPTLLKALTLLRYLVTGNFQTIYEDLHLSQATISLIVNDTCQELTERTGDFIRFPPADKMNDVQSKFHQMGGFPGVSGIIDTTHIPILSPGGAKANTYKNRKGFMSLSCQIVCGPDFDFYDFTCRWPGSAIDSFMFDRSSVKKRFQKGELCGHLLGDCAYPQSECLYTPFQLAQTQTQAAYNLAHDTTRATIETAIEIWKRKFPILQRRLQNKLHNTVNLIIAAAILHNMTKADNPLYDHTLPVLGENDLNNTPVVVDDVPAPPAMEDQAAFNLKRTFAGINFALARNSGFVTPLAELDYPSSSMDSS